MELDTPPRVGTVLIRADPAAASSSAVEKLEIGTHSVHETKRESVGEVGI